MIPCVIVHLGNRPYLKINVEITCKNNLLYFIGDESCSYLQQHPNCIFINISKYEKQWISDLEKHFVNYSSNSRIFEWLCFKRVFILKEFLKDYELESVFHMDSDNILLHDINKFHFTEKVAYLNSYPWKTTDMCSSIHCALLTLEFCNVFEQLFKDIFVNKLKLNLLREKIDYHYVDKDRFVNGGVCDMTFYFLINKLELVRVQNLMEQVLFKEDDIYVNTFMNNYGVSEGISSKEQFRMSNGVIEIEKHANGADNLITDITTDKQIRVWNIHFQGSNKSFMNESLKSRINF